MKNDSTALEYAKKKKRTFDQMASMHFIRADKHSFYAELEDCVEIIISVALCGLTFFDWQTIISSFPIVNRYFPGFAGIFLFAFTFLKRIFNHSGISHQHYVAGKMLTQAKLDLGNRIEQWKVQDAKEEEILQYLDNHYQNLNDLPQIPENSFAKLKHKHQYKIAFSKFLDKHKECCWWCCKIKFFFKSIKFKEDSDNLSGSETKS